MTYGTINADLITTSDGVSAAGLYGMKNRIINGDMRIDQRNAGASVTPVSGQYTLDRWVATLTQSSKFTVQRNAAAVTPPVGFTNYLGVTSSSAYSVLTGDTFLISQQIEGFNVADLAWGTANAQTVTLSFWVRSSLTGTFGGCLLNSASNRSYPFSYTVSSANTWEKETITIAGDTSGTWVTDNGIGMYVRFGLGSGATFSGTAGAWAAGNFVQPTGSTSVVGTNGATFYITGVQLEKGSTATSFDYRDYGRELRMCQRYYFRNTADQAYSIFGAGQGVSTTSVNIYSALPVSMRATPTVNGSTLRLFSGTTGFTVTGFDSTLCSKNVGSLGVTVASGLTAGQGYYLQGNNNTAAYVEYSAEL
jgi:hypothetical protein